MNSLQDQLNPDKYYSAHKIAKMGLLHVTTPQIVSKYLLSDKGKELFSPLIRIVNNQIRVSVRGDKLIEVLGNGPIELNHGTTT